jgi:hypothetical protein
LIVVLGTISIPAAIAGDTGITINLILIVLGSVGYLMLNPAVRPKNVVRSRCLECFQRIGRPSMEAMWTPLEVTIWFLAIIFAIVAGILFLTEVIGPWVLIIEGAIATVVGLMRYSAETEQVKRNADDQGE